NMARCASPISCGRPARRGGRSRSGWANWYARGTSSAAERAVRRGIRWAYERPESLSARLFIQHGERALVQRLGLGGGVADSRETKATALAQRRQHVKHYASLIRLVEVQPVAHGDVEDVVRGERAVGRRLDVVAGDE